HPTWFFSRYLCVYLVVSRQIETVMETEMKASLGQNVTLNCSIIEQNLWWHMEVHGRLRACIGRVMGGVFYLQNALPSAKYKSLKMNQLMVTDIQQEDYRLYFCGRRRDDNINFTDAFRIVPSESGLQIKGVKGQKAALVFFNDELEMC
uniref:Immunoglobulin V-set domain-containing protein n=1 Tax=Mola mola TaxID=94237 RepID=A0A3Q4BEX8_MOLML